MPIYLFQRAISSVYLLPRLRVFFPLRRSTVPSTNLVSSWQPRRSPFFNGTSDLEKLLITERLLRIPNFEGTRHLTSESRYHNSETNKDNPSPIPFFWIILLTSAGIAFYLGYQMNLYQPHVIPNDAFMQLLEKGEVTELVLNPHSPYAFAKLHELYPGTNRKVVVVPMFQSLENFEKMIRQKEKVWGITQDDQLPIRYGNVQSLETHGSSPIALVMGSLFFSALAITLYIYWSLKRGKLSQFQRTTLFTPEKEGSAPRTHRSKPSTDSGKATSPGDSRTSSDRYTGGLPFSWDPFSGFQSIRPVTTDVKFKDVAGLHASKQEVMEFVSYLKDPKKYQALGAKLPKGALLLGPPGTGKTLLVKALANESGVPFFSMAGSEFVEVIGGLGASRIRQLFRTARSNPPAIIFIDELDSLGRRRASVDTGGRPGSQRGSGGGGGGGVSEMEQTLNQLLVEMDGMDTAEGTIVFAATNRSDLLDKALLRAGRFDRHIYIDLPNLAERKELLAMYMSKYRLSPTVLQGVLIERMASWTPGMSGADIARLCNEAALIAARRDQPLEGVTRDDFEAAFERVLAGAAKQSNPLSPPERRVAAVQEAGRALVACLLPRTGLVPVKVSIVPRTTAGFEGSGGLGFTHLVPEERRLFTTEELADRMAVMLGGRAAEEVVFRAVSDASQRYLQEASDLALKQVREWGMSKAVGHLSFQDNPSGNEFTIKPYSQRTQQMIEMEAQRLVSSAFKRCLDLLQSNKHLLKRLTEALLKKEVLTYDEVAQICKGDATPRAQA